MCKSAPPLFAFQISRGSCNKGPLIFHCWFSVFNLLYPSEVVFLFFSLFFFLFFRYLFFFIFQLNFFSLYFVNVDDAFCTVVGITEDSVGFMGDWIGTENPYCIIVYPSVTIFILCCGVLQFPFQVISCLNFHSLLVLSNVPIKVLTKESEFSVKYQSSE